MDSILRILKDNPRLSNAEIAAMTGLSADEAGERIAHYERTGVIRGYRTVIDPYMTEQTDKVTAIIELKVTPRKDTGFESIAEEIMGFDDVESVSLMSGGYDFSVCVTGRTFQEIALFVAKRLATLDSVTSTTTTFVLKKYKEDGIILSSHSDERGADVF